MLLFSSHQTPVATAGAAADSEGQDGGAREGVPPSGEVGSCEEPGAAVWSTCRE